MATKSVKKTVKEAARMGKGRDNTLAHLASGEVVIPVGFQQKFPAVGAALKQAFEKAGLDYEQFVVGSPKNRINPRTGAPMFDDGGGGDDGGDGGQGGDEGGESGDEGSEAGYSGPAGEAMGAAAAGYGFSDAGFTGEPGYSGPAGEAMGAAAADAGYGSTGSTGTAGGDPAGGAPAGGPTGGDPTGGPIGGDPNLDPEPDIPSGYQMQGTLPGQATANSIFDALLGFLAPSSTLVQDPTAEQVQSGFRGGVGTSSPQEQGARAEAIAREDQINALREDVARNEEAANALMQAHQQSQAAAAAQQAAANAGVTSGGLLSGQSLVDNSLGLTAPSPGPSDIYGGMVYSSGPTTSQEIVSGPATNQDTTSFPEGDLAGTTENLGMGTTEGQQGNTGSNLSALDVTEITNAPSVFDLTTTGNLSNVPYSDENYYVGSDGGDVPIPLTEEELLKQQQQVSIAPTVTPVKYDISKFISGIGSLATSKQA